MTGIELIAVERRRQIDVEGWSAGHDDEHILGEMISAGITYASHAVTTITDYGIDLDDLGIWPWAEEWWKPGDPIQNLAKAAALFAAEIDRLQRAQERTNVL